MKHKRNLILPALLLPALLAFSSRADDVSFHPGGGATLTKTYTQSQEISLDEMSVSQNGQEIDPSMFGGMEMTTTSNQTITVTDEYVTMGDGQPGKLRRTFDKLSADTNATTSNPMMGEQSTDMTSQSELEGLTVVFTWNAEEGKYDLAFDEDAGGDEELLEGLVEDMDLRGLLPDAEVSAGDVWDVDPEAVRTIFAPGGAVKLLPDNLDELMGGNNGPQPTPDQFLGDLEGEVSAEYGGTRDEDGVTVGVITLKLDVHSAKDLTDFMLEMMDNVEVPGAEDMSIDSFDMEFAFEGEGQLLWNLEAGLPYSLDLTGTVSTIVDTAMSMTVQGRKMGMETALTMAGSMTLGLETGAGE